MPVRGRFSLFASFALLAGLIGCGGGSSTLTPIVRATPMPTATATTAATATPTPSATATATASPTPTTTSSASAGPTPTATPTINPSAPPTISSISPTSGPVGSMVTIDGSGFEAATSIEFTGGVYASGNINSDTMIVVQVPIGALTGPITVNTTNGSVTSGTYTVTP